MAGTNLSNIGGARVSDTQGNRRANTPANPLPSQSRFSPETVKRNITANATGPGKALFDVGNLAIDAAEDMRTVEAKRQAQLLETNNNLEDRANNKVNLQLARDFQLETGNIVSEFASQDMSKAKVRESYNKKLSTSLEFYQKKYAEEGGTDRGFDDFNEKIFAHANELQDEGIIRQRDDTLTAIKKSRGESFNSLNNPDKIDGSFGANPRLMIPSMLLRAEEITRDVNKGLGPEDKNATVHLGLSAVQNAAFDFYMRRGDLDAIETLFSDTRFDRINGGEGEVALRKRWQKAKNSKHVTVYNTRTDTTESVLESEQQPWQVDPSTMTTEINVRGLRADMAANAKLDPKEQQTTRQLFDARGIKMSDEKFSTLGQEYEDNKLLAKKYSKGDEKAEAELLKVFDDKTTRNAIPTTGGEKAFAKGQDKSLEKLGEAQQDLDTLNNPDIPQETKDVLTPSADPLPAAIQSENRRSLVVALGGDVGEDGKTTFVDPIKLKIFNAVLPASAKILRKNPAITVAEAQAQAFSDFAKESGIKNPAQANMYSTVADRVVEERSSRKLANNNVAPQRPYAGFTSGNESRQQLIDELRALKEARKGSIKPGKAAGVISSLEQLWADLPGQIFEETVDEETLEARLALLRVSREVMTLVMKNDRFAIAEQIIINPLLERPSALSSGKSINAQLRRYKNELEQGIKEAQLNIADGFKRDENLEKVVDYTRIATMLDQFVIDPPLAETSAADILKITDKDTFGKLEKRMKTSDWRSMSREQKDAMKTMQARMDLDAGFTGASGEAPEQPQEAPRDLESVNAELKIAFDKEDLTTLNNFSASKNEELDALDTQLNDPNISDEERKRLQRSHDSVSRVLNAIESSISSHPEGAGQ